MTPTFVEPTTLSDEYMISVFVPRPGRPPIVVRAFLTSLGWITAWRDFRGRLRQSVVSSKAEAFGEVGRVATARLRGGS